MYLLANLQGPDGSTGFAPNWTERVSTHATNLSVEAQEFIPSSQLPSETPDENSPDLVQEEMANES